MPPHKFVVKCGNFAVLVDLHALPLGVLHDSWISAELKEEVAGLVRGAVEQRVRLFIDTVRRRGQAKQRRELPPATPLCVRGTGFSLIANFVRRHFNLRCIVKERYGELRVFPERYVVCASRPDDAATLRGNPIQTVTELSEQSKSEYFSRPGETQEPLNSSTITKRTALQKMARQANAWPKPCGHALGENRLGTGQERPLLREDRPSPAEERPLLRPSPAEERPILRPSPAEERPILRPSPAVERPILRPSPAVERPILREDRPSPAEERPIIRPSPAEERPILRPSPTPEVVIVVPSPDASPKANGMGSPEVTECSAPGRRDPRGAGQSQSRFGGDGGGRRGPRSPEEDPRPRRAKRARLGGPSASELAAQTHSAASSSPPTSEDDPLPLPPPPPPSIGVRAKARSKAFPAPESSETTLEVELLTPGKRAERLPLTSNNTEQTNQNRPAASLRGLSVKPASSASSIGSRSRGGGAGGENAPRTSRLRRPKRS